MNKHTYPYGIIGNGSYMAHIDDRAAVAWLCWPSFDSSFVFGNLLDKTQGGHFTILPPEEKFHTTQSYVENTNVLSTTFETNQGSFRVIDFAPRFQLYDRYHKPLMLFRKIEPLTHNPVVRISCHPRGNYGQLIPEVQLGSNHIRFSGFENQLRLTTNIPLNYVVNESQFVLNETKHIALTWGIPLEAPLETTVEEFLRKTIVYWQNWVKNATIGNFHQESVIRSALALKLHQFEDTGAIIAAGTTSLPESPGSERNWDYRYCWLRDSFYTLNALNHIGHFEELEKYSFFVQNIAISIKDRYRPIYSIRGESNLIEKSLELEGYCDSRPVRIGNQAHEHVQNDVYGQILVSLLPLYIDQRFPNKERYTSLHLIQQLLRRIEETMDEPDAGLWEFRNRSQKHCYTFLFHWAGSCAARKIAQALQNKEMELKANELIRAAANQIELCYKPKLSAYGQAIETNNLDASLLQLITMNYLDPSSDRAQAHLQTLERELKTPEGLFYRYKHADDFGKPKVTFLVCAYWYVEALATLGRVEEAVSEFEQLLKYSNHLGLMSEDVEPSTGSQWGNFPQTYSHVGLMNAAFRISRKLDRPHFV